MAIVVGLSSTALGQRVLERAIEEARLFDVPLVLVSHLVTPRTDTEASEFSARRQEIEGMLAERAAQIEAQGVRCTTFLPGSPCDASEAVLAAAEEHDADMIVVGIRRRSPVGKLLLGSTAQDILLAADCAVLGVKVPADEEDF